MSVVKLSSKGQVVIPKDIRERLELKDGDRLKVSVEAKKITLTPVVKFPSDLSVKAGAEAIKEFLGEAKKNDKAKLTDLLAALGVKD